MQPELIDEWDVPSKDIDGLIFHVRVEHEPDHTPYEYGDGSAYDDPEVLKAWEREDWWFVYTEVTPGYRGVLLAEAANGLGGTEWGFFPGAEPRDDREYFTNVHPLPDYILPEIMHNLREHVSRKSVRRRKRDAFKTWQARRWALKQDARTLKELRKQLKD